MEPGLKKKKLFSARQVLFMLIQPVAPPPRGAGVYTTHLY